MNGPHDRPLRPQREELDVQSLGLHAAQAQAAPAVRKKRRWWLYVLIGAGSMLVLALLALVLIAGYLKSLVTNYTAPAPKPFPRMEVDAQKQKELENRWTEFARAIQARQTPPALIITADDINMALSGNKELRDRVRVVITNSRVLAEFSVPLDQVGWQNLKGRYFNGVAKLDVVFKDGWLNVNIGSVDANGRPLPGWILNKLKQENLGKGLDHNREVVNVLQQIDSIKVEGSSIVITPAGANR
jgi:hypothetical protein